VGTADLHIHTRYGDGMATVPDVLDFVEGQRDLDVVAITEHDTMRAAEEARVRLARGHFRFDVIPGMEITTLDGHLLALFVDEPIESFRRMEPTLEAIHRQGGLAIVPHPLSWLTRSVKTKIFDRIRAAGGNDGVYFDAIEEYNMSPAGRVTSARARILNRERLGLAAVGSSDAHFLASIGSAQTRFEGSTAADLRNAIEGKATSGEAVRAPTMAELGYRNIALQSVRGMLATPRNTGWGPTVRSFVVSHLRHQGFGRRAGSSGQTSSGNERSTGDP
jgi:predicted metal-dependent phosphoesterase TrpH